MLARTTGISDLGCVRQNNEDSLLIDEALGLFAVADGMGGHEDGEVASRRALRLLYAKLKGAKIEERLHQMSPRTLLEMLANAMTTAASAIRKEVNKGHKMGTTMTVLWLAHGKAIMGHVGDSRLYLKRGQNMRQVSEDHTLVAQLVKTGKLAPEDADSHHMRNVLLRSMGGDGHFKADTKIINVKNGDLFVLCSDGLTGHVNDDEIASALPCDDQKAGVQTLVDLAKARGGTDNITTIAIHIQDIYARSADPRYVSQTRVPTRISASQDRRPKMAAVSLDVRKLQKRGD